MARPAPKQRWIPKDSREALHPEGLGACYSYSIGHRFAAIGYPGKKMKADFHIVFPSETRRDQYVSDWFEAQQQKASERKRLQEAKRQPHGCKPGDVFVYQWGYDQTNTEFFQVTRTTNRTAWLKRIGQTYTGGGMDMAGTTVPTIGQFRDEKEIRKQVTLWTLGSVPCFSMPYGLARLWDGRPARWSGYA